jgi:Putative bacterial sensory transduction regulator
MAPQHFMEDLTPFYAIIEASIRRLDIDPDTCRGEQPGQWNLTHGSAHVWMDLWHIELQQRAYFQVMSPVMQMPANPAHTQALFEELLQINDKLFGVAFSLYKGMVWLKTIREARGMDADEALNILTRVAKYADMYDDYLVNKYQASFPAQVETMAPPQTAWHESAPTQQPPSPSPNPSVG